MEVGSITINQSSIQLLTDTCVQDKASEEILFS